MRDSKMMLLWAALVAILCCSLAGCGRDKKVLPASPPPHKAQPELEVKQVLEVPTSTITYHDPGQKPATMEELVAENAKLKTELEAAKSAAKNCGADLTAMRAQSETKKVAEKSLAEKMGGVINSCLVNETTEPEKPEWVEGVENRNLTQEEREAENAKKALFEAQNLYSDCYRPLTSYITMSDEERGQKYSGVTATIEQVTQRRDSLVTGLLKATAKCFSLPKFPSKASFFTESDEPALRIYLVVDFIETAQDHGVNPISVETWLTPEAIGKMLDQGFDEVATHLRNANPDDDLSYAEVIRQDICNENDDAAGPGRLFKYTTPEQRKLIKCGEEATEVGGTDGGEATDGTGDNSETQPAPENAD